jgi:hypothetical protein
MFIQNLHSILCKSRSQNLQRSAIPFRLVLYLQSVRLPGDRGKVSIAAGAKEFRGAMHRSTIVYVSRNR